VRPAVPRFVVLLTVAAVAAFLYARPISNYLHTRSDLEARQTEVDALRADRARLRSQLARTTSLDALARQARALGYVRPGERLFIVKGIPAWRRTHLGTVSGDGRP
jgi:cell division protein FtsB